MNSTIPPRSRLADLPPREFAPKLTTPVVLVAAQAADLGVMVRSLWVHFEEYRDFTGEAPSVSLDVQVDSRADVDRFAEHFGLADDGGEGTNYSRRAVVRVGVHELTLSAYAPREVTP